MALSWVSITLIVFLLTSVYIRKRLRARSSQDEQYADGEEPGRFVSDTCSKPARLLRAKLVAAIPHIVIGPENTKGFKKLTNAYWDKKACEVQPACVVRPRNVWELAQAVKIMKRNFDLRILNENESASEFFAIRGGGCSPVAGASSIAGGILIDLSLLKEVKPSLDRKSVAIGAGCKWTDVYKALKEDGISVVGGRNSAVGVGGLALGGGLSFFSPEHGLVCSNIIEYEVVLADGTVVTASQTVNSDLWCALKGGSNIFGIVTKFTMCSFPSEKIWSGFLYLPSWQASRVLSSFYDGIVTNNDSQTHEKHAAGPLVCFTYLQQLGIQAIAINLAHTNPPINGSKWPACWQSSGFQKLWRFWSTCSIRSLTSATDELSVLNPPGRRQEFATTTVKNDMATLQAVHNAYSNAIASIRTQKIQRMSWTLVLQPLHPHWARKGDKNVLGLDSGTAEPLVIVSFTVNWVLSRDDEIVQSIVRNAIEQIDAFADAHKTGHRYRYLNYCASWQKPFEGYGQDNLEFLKEVSRRVDPDGLFQKGCTGGFKLGL